MRKTFFVISIVLFSIYFMGCAGTHFKWDDARKLTEGMSKNEVTALIGAPYSVTTNSVNGSVKEIWVWSYADSFTGSRSLALTFIDGKLAEAPYIPPEYK